MALIRCLGDIKIPRSYRHFLRQEREEYSTRRKLCNPWFQEIIAPDRPGYEEYLKKKVWTSDTSFHEVDKPKMCPLFTKALGSILSGRQVHVAMTLVSAEPHTDYFDDQLDTVFVIPFMLSACHFLFVEDEYRELIPNKIYAFNQKRIHGLHYGRGDYQESLSSRPASLMSISFIRK